MANPVGHRLGVPAFLQRYRGVKMPEASQGNVGTSGLLCHALNVISQGIGMAPILQAKARKDHFRRVHAQLLCQLLLLLLVFPQNCDGLLVKIHNAAPAVGFWTFQNQALLGDAQGRFNQDRPCIQIYACPP